MLQKFKITACAFILVLFGFALMTVSSSESEAQDDVIPSSELQCIFFDSNKGQEEVCWIQSGLDVKWYDEASAHCSQSEQCGIYLEDMVGYYGSYEESLWLSDPSKYDNEVRSVMGRRQLTWGVEAGVAWRVQRTKKR